MNTNTNRADNKYSVMRMGLGITIFGFLIFVLGVSPRVFWLDRSPVTGFVQITVFLVGLAFICLGGYISLNACWRGTEKTIAADIGFRLVCTGYVIAVVSGMADVFGFGAHNFPNIPFFGPLQALGVMFSEVVIVIGLGMMVPFGNPHHTSPETKE